MAIVNSSELSDRLLDFAIRVATVAENLPSTRLGQHVAGQIVRSGTSPAANYEEACGAHSKKDFVHKLRICLKELRETKIWLRLIVRANLMTESRLQELLHESDQLARIIGKSIVTTKGIVDTSDQLKNEN
jgi:four helix bundle protein